MDTDTNKTERNKQPDTVNKAHPGGIPPRRMDTKTAPLTFKDNPDLNSTVEIVAVCRSATPGVGDIKILDTTGPLYWSSKPVSALTAPPNKTAATFPGDPKLGWVWNRARKKWSDAAGSEATTNPAGVTQGDIDSSEGGSDPFVD
jgi:hypothetical protein